MQSFFSIEDSNLQGNEAEGLHRMGKAACARVGKVASGENDGDEPEVREDDVE